MVQSWRSRAVLNEAELMCSLAAEAASDAVVVIDEQSTILFVNRSTERVFGYRQEELVGQQLTMLMPDYLRLPHKNALKRHLMTGVKHLSWERVELPGLHKTGREIALEISFGEFEIRGKHVFTGVCRDVTERAEYQRARFLLAAIVESSEDAIVGKTLDGIITSWNKGAEQIYGYTASEIIGQSISVLAPPQLAHQMTELLQRLQRGERIQHFETLRVTKQGKIIEVSLSVSPVYNSRGEIVAASAVARDITRQKQSEIALRRSEEQYRLLFENNHLPTWVVDRESGQFLAVNEAAVRHYGYSRDEFLSMNILHINPGEDIPAPLNKAGGPGLRDVEVRKHRKKDGTIIEVEITSHELRFQDREAELMLAREVTNQRRFEERLRQSEERFSKAFRSSPVAISITTAAEGRYLDVNDAFLRLIGYGRQEVVGRTEAELAIYQGTEDGQPILDALKQPFRAQSVKGRFRTKSGEVRKAQQASELIQLGELTCVLAVIDDVTEAERTEERLRHAQKMEAVGRLAGGVAHDFNNILGVIIGYSEILEDPPQSYEHQRKYASEIRKAAERGASLTRQLLAFSRRQISQPQTTNLNAVIANLSSMLRRMIGEDIELILACDSSLSDVRVDLAQIEQVIMNLVVNARDAMPEGGKLIIQTSNVELHETYTHRLYEIPPGRYVMLSVSDNGWGIDPDVLPHIFEPFFTTKAPDKGTGLGLSTVYGIVEQNSGRILVHSEPGKGTTVKIYLLRSDATASAGTPRLPDIVGKGSETVLLVEDDAALRSLIQNVLQNRGYTVLEAADPQAAIELCGSHPGPIHLLLTDMVMPGMSGRDLRDELTGSHPEMRALFISGYATETSSLIDSFVLEKPFSTATLLSKIQSVLHEHRRAS